MGCMVGCYSLVAVEMGRRCWIEGHLECKVHGPPYNSLDLEEHKKRSSSKRTPTFLACPGGWVLMLFTARGDRKKIEVAVVVIDFVIHSVLDRMNLRHF